MHTGLHQVSRNSQATCRVLLVAACFAAAGCASLSDRDCSVVNWHEQGYDDGNRAGYSRIDTHTQRCVASGVTPDLAQYQKGWDKGWREQPPRSGGD